MNIGDKRRINKNGSLLCNDEINESLKNAWYTHAVTTAETLSCREIIRASGKDIIVTILVGHDVKVT